MLRKHGIIDSKQDRYASEGLKPIKQHLDDWEENLRSRGVSEKQVQLVVGRATRVLERAGISGLKDIRESHRTSSWV